MTKKEYCESHRTIGVWDNEVVACKAKIHGFEYDCGKNYNCVYFTGICGEKTTFHRSKIRYYDGNPFFSWGGKDIYFDDVMWL